MTTGSHAGGPAAPGRLATLAGPRWLRVALAVLLAAAGLALVTREVARQGGRVFDDPACVPESPPGCWARSDIFPRLVGTRLAWHRESPYGQHTYDVLVSGYMPPETANPQRFFYPLPLAVVLAPLAVLPYGVAGAAFTWITTAVFLACMALLMRAGSGGRIPWLVAVGLTGLIAAFSRLFGTAVVFQQPALLIAALQAVACVALVRGRWTLAGVFAGLSLVKPQFAIVSALVVAAALLRHDRSRRGLLAMGGTLVVLLGVSFALVPAWVGQFLDEVRFYEQVNPTDSVLGLLGLSTPAIAALTGVVAALLVGAVLALPRGGAAGLPLGSAYLGAIALALLVIPRIPLWIGPYDHQALLLGMALLGGALVAGRHRVAGVAVMATPVVAMLTWHFMGRWQGWVDALAGLFGHLDGLAIQPGMRYGGVVSDQLVQTVGVVVLLVACAWVAWAPEGLGEARARLGRLVAGLKARRQPEGAS